MFGFFLWIIILFIIIGSRISKENKKAQQRNQNRPQMQQGMYTPQQTMASVRRQEAAAPQKRPVASQQKMPEWLKSSGTYTPKNNTQKKPSSDIVERAKKNNQHFTEDETLTEIEKMHGHKEKEAPIKLEHEAVCRMHTVDSDADLWQESMFGSAEDLIAKGYDGNMNFERDFLAEAMDMINNYN